MFNAQIGVSCVQEELVEHNAFHPKKKHVHIRFRIMCFGIYILKICFGKCQRIFSFN